MRRFLLIAAAVIVICTSLVSAKLAFRVGNKKTPPVLSLAGAKVASANNYFVLGLQKCDANSNFTIHGLWPQSGPYGRQSFCTQVTFTESAISDLLPQMDTYWLSCPKYGNPNREFWTHEYEKHGSCAPSSWSEHDYFQAGLDVYFNGSWVPYCDNSQDECQVHVFPSNV